jgi:GDPmannose 4,6-dehydratase
MWLMLQQPDAGDYILATGQACSVRDFTRAAFASIEIELSFENTDSTEIGRDPSTGQALVQVDPRFYRPVEPERLVGDPNRAADVLGWRPRTTAAALAELMVHADWASASASPSRP